MMRTLFSLWILPLLAMTSCVVGPNIQKLSKDLPDNWHAVAPSFVEGEQSGMDARWWKQFHDPDLNRLIEDAIAQNLILRTAALRILESRAVLGIARGTQFPQFQALSGDLLRSAQGGSGPNRFITSASLGFDVAWEVDLWGKFRRNVESAEAVLLADVASYDDILVSLTAEVATLYVNIRTLEERIRLARQNEELQVESLKLVETQFEAGDTTKLDALQARSLLSTTRAQIPNLQASQAKLYHALAVLLGQAPGGIESRFKAGRGIPSFSDKVRVGVPADLLRRRPDIRAAEMAALAQSAQIGVAKSNLYPAFTLLGSLQFSANDLGPNQLSQLLDASSGTGIFGPSFSWNILNYGRIRNNVRAQDARFEQAVANYEQTVLNAAREVEDGMTGYLYARREAVFLRDGVEAARESAELSQLQYTEGLADYQRVLDSIRSLTQKQDQLAAVEGFIMVNLISTYKALGGAWMMPGHDRSVSAEIRDRMQERTNWGKTFEGQSDASEPPPTVP